MKFKSEHEVHITESSFLAVINGFKGDEQKGYAGYMVLYDEIKEAIKEFGRPKTCELLKEVFG